jgi:predicted acyl esterase
MRAWLATVVALGWAAALAGSAQAAPVAGVLAGQTVSGNPIPCSTQTDGVRVCHGSDGGGGAGDLRLKSFDGAPLEAYVILPPAPAAGPDGGYPLVVQSHGWGGAAGGPDDPQFLGPTADAWARNGYAVLQMTARGFGDSCGKATPAAAQAPCANGGYIHLDDSRYEARDVQYATGLLVDGGLVNLNAIGVTGESYGGGVSLELATLKDRVMNPNGSLIPWTSPAGTPLHIAAAAPTTPWSDLVSSLMPNGRTREDQITSASADLAPIGVSKQSLASGLLALGAAYGTYSTTDPQSDFPAWLASITAGEPYESNPLTQTITTQMARYRSPYFLLDGAYGTGQESPAPLLIANGFTDDLFPVDEALRYANLEHALYPSDPIALLDGDFGHPRAQNKPAELALLSQRIAGFFDYYLKGAGSPPPLGATAFTETCPKSAPSGGPFTASSWNALHPGQVGYASTRPQTIRSSAGNPAISAAVDPVAGQGACASVPAADQGTGVASYRLPGATGTGYTLLGAATITANLTVTGTYPEIAARLWDVDPTTNTETLVARGVYRIDPANPNGTQTIALHPGAWHFAAGHIPKLELLGQDAPYVRRSNGTFSVAVNTLQLVLPVHDTPGAAGASPAVVRYGTPAPSVCVARPSSRLGRHQETGRDRGLLVTGTASERACASDAPATRSRERVAVVYLTVVSRLAHNRCRYVEATGRLSGARSCGTPIRLRAQGTGHWQMRIRGIAPGQYLITADAVDALHRHQPASRSSSVRVRIR